jgi:hypothetical protein
VNLPQYLPSIAATHVYSNIDRVLDRIGPGTASLNWKVDGKRADGTPFTVQGANRYASGYDISYDAAGPLWDLLYSIENNRYEDAHVTAVTVDGDVQDELLYETISAVSVREPDGTYTKLSYNKPLRVEPGSQLALRVTLKPYGEAGPLRDVDTSFTVPAGGAGSGTLRVIGGESSGYYYYGYDDYYPSSSATDTFDTLLENLNTVVPGDSFDVSLSLRTYGAKDTTKLTKRHTSDKVVGGGLSIPVYVAPPKSPGAGVVDGATWKLRSTMTAGKATKTMTYGKSTDQGLAGDFDGNGAKSPAVFRDGQWWIKMTNTQEKLVGVKFGQKGDQAVVGDWDGDGKDTIGVYRAGRWLLDNDLDGKADRDFTFGDASADPVVGDWNGDGFDTVGTFKAGKWTVRNTNTSTSPLTTFTYGKAGDIPVVGDWEGDGRDEPGVYRAGVWTIRPNLTTGTGTWFRYGGETSRPVVWG